MKLFCCVSKDETNVDIDCTSHPNVKRRGDHTFSAGELLIKWTSQNDLPTTKIQNIYLLINILRIYFNICWCIPSPCLLTWAHVAQHN